MTKQFLFISLVLSSLSFLTSCTDGASSGPCDYTEEKFNMRVINVAEDPDHEHMYIVTVDFDGNVKWAEGQHTMAEIRNVTTDVDFIINNNIREGAVYTGTMFKVVPGSGNCEDDIVDWGQKLKK